MSVFILITQLCFGNDVSNCRDLMNWIYRDLTLNNLDKSYERLMNKFLIGLLHAHKKSKKKFKYQKELVQILNTLNELDADFEKLTEGNRTQWLTNIFLSDKTLAQTKLNLVFESWRNLQTNQSKLFKGLDQKYLLDDWDMLTVDILSHVDKFTFSDNDRYRQRLDLLADSLKNEQINVLNGASIDVSHLKNQIDATQKELKATLTQAYEKNMTEYGYVCRGDDLSMLLERENYICPTSLNDQTNPVRAELNQIAGILNQSEALLMPKPKIKVGDETKVHVEDYIRNDDAQTTYCIRDPELASMIVIHHTQTNATSTPAAINQHHLDRSTEGDKWYMVGYNYMISSTYSESESYSVIQGRAPDIRGAHAGGYTAPLTEDQKEYYANKTIRCGNKYIGFKEMPATAQMNSEGGISGNLISFGVAVIGNYSPIEWTSILGVTLPQNIYSTQPSRVEPAMLEKVARFSCDLQKQYPNVKTIVPHMYFRATKCPGEIIEHLNQIASIANRMGCNFKVVLKKGEELK